jgi:hypothetical protein
MQSRIFLLHHSGFFEILVEVRINLCVNYLII